MNVPKAVEIAIAAVLRKRELGASVLLRCWQNLRADGSWKPSTDRSFPVVDIRCSPPTPDTLARTTLIASCQILCGTNADDDRDHAFISKLYEECQTACDLLYAQARGTAGTELNDFTTALNDLLGTELGNFNFDGFQFGDSIAPYDDDGVNAVGFTMQVHYSRNDL